MCPYSLHLFGPLPFKPCVISGNDCYVILANWHVHHFIPFSPDKYFECVIQAVHINIDSITSFCATSLPVPVVLLVIEINFNLHRFCSLFLCASLGVMGVCTQGQQV